MNDFIIRDIITINQKIIIQVFSILATMLVSYFSYKKLFRSIIVKSIRSFSFLTPGIKYPIMSSIRETFFLSVFTMFMMINSVAFSMLEFNHNIIDFLTILLFVFVTLKSVAIFSGKKNYKFAIWVIISIMILEEYKVTVKIRELLGSVTFKMVDIEISLYKMLSVLITILITNWVVSIILNIGRTIIKEKTVNLDNHTIDLKYKIFNYIVYLLTAIVMLTIIGVQANHIALFGSAIGIGIGLGLQKTSSNFISGIILLAEKNVKIGDVLELENGQIGKIKKLGIRAMVVTTYDGKDIIIPNEVATSKETINYTLFDNKIRLSTNLYIVNKKDIKLALELMKRACLAQKNIVKSKPVVCCARDINERGIRLMSLFWISDFDGSDILNIKSQIISATMDLFFENNIELYFEKSVNVLRDTLHSVSSTNELKLPPLANRFSKSQSIVNQPDTTNNSNEKFSEYSE